MFDALTLERVLQFIYQGDYTVTAVEATDADNSRNLNTLADESANATDKVADAHSLPAEDRRLFTMNKHERVQKKRKPGTNFATAHLYVYAMADHYELPRLKALALGKFSDPANAVASD